MRVYSVYLRRRLERDPDRAVIAIKDGFCWPAFFFSVLWAIWHRLWLTALLFLVLDAAVVAMTVILQPDFASELAISIGFAAVVGVVANDLRRWTLAHRGWDDAGDVLARDATGAEHRFLDSQPALAAELLV